MGKIALLVSREEMIHQAHNILQGKDFVIEEMRVIQTENAVSEARKSIAGGASIIIARGLQASLIKQYTDIPVVEIVMTAQEMALLVMKAKQIVKKPRPVIAVVGFKNMFCDMTYFDTLYEIELRTYIASQGSELKATAKMAVTDQVDLVIGGDTSVGVATEAGVPSLFLSITEDSLSHACSMAARMDYAMGIEKKNAAQMETLLDYSFNGVIRLDQQGLITDINPLVEDMLGSTKTQIAGKRIESVFIEIDEEIMAQVLEEGKEYSLFMQVNQVSVFAVFAPILVETGQGQRRVDGAIITCNKMKKKQLTPGGTHERTGRGRMTSLVRFEDILQTSPSMQETIRLAKLYSLSEKPVVIMGEAGTEKGILAQSIHNSGLHSEGPYLEVSCEGLDDEMQRTVIFGERGGAMQVSGGTLMIQDGDWLTPANQYRLYRLIRHRVCIGTDASQMRSLNVRVMMAISRPLIELVKEGIFREDLYYLLSGLVIKIPPLRERKEDLKEKIAGCMKECCDRYSRYHILTHGAWDALLAYPWNGNQIQIESYFERLILTVGRRSIDEIAVNELLLELYPNWEKEERQRVLWSMGKETEENTPSCEEAAQILQSLAKHDRNREKTAKELGISKATLWRHMKKYGIK